MAWLNPGALAALAAVSLPILVHLLLRRRAPRVLFPSVRFIAPTEESAVRVRVPSDLLLLLVRIGIVVCAAVALARPLLLTDARREAWTQRTSRAIVVDTSASVDAASATQAAAAEARVAAAARRFDSTDLRDALRRAAAWLREAEPGLREVVVVSDFQRGTLAESDVSDLPEAVGLRVLKVDGTARDTTSFDAGAVFHSGATLSQTVALNGTATGVTLNRLQQGTSGLQIDADPTVASKILRVVSEAGAIAPSAEHPLIVRFDKAARKGPPYNTDHRAADRAIVTIDAPPDSLDAAAAVQAALNARRNVSAWTEHEPQSIPSSVLASWTRKPGPVDPTSWRRSTESDGRWLWLAAILLMGVETVLRRERRKPAVDVEAHAA